MSRLEIIMADLVATLKRVPGVMEVRDEAPREDEDFDVLDPKKGLTPLVNVWEQEEVPELFSDNAFQCPLPITVELVYPYSLTDPTRGLRKLGRQWKARIQTALMEDIGRGWDETYGVRNAFDTIEQDNLIAPTAAPGFGVVRLRYVVRYQRSMKDPSRLAA